jgi:hypothetical protein
MDRLLDDIGRAYDKEIQIPGKELAFLILVAFLCSFGFIRTSAHMIKAQVSWWPGNVETKGGTHIHHLVWGILLLMVCGYLGIAIADTSPWLELIAILFGIGMGLTLDEFALWLNLEDVYWSQKGRQSIDAVIAATTLLIITLLGLQFLIDLFEAGLVFLGYGGERLDGGETAALLVPWQVLGAALAIVCFLKGKILMGIVGLMFPIVALVGAIRLAKPDTPWGRRYTDGKRERSRKRFEKDVSAPAPQPASSSA